MNRLFHVRKKFLHRLIAGLIAVFLCWVLFNWLGNRILRPLAISQIKQLTGADVQIESVDFDWKHPHHFSIENLTTLNFLAKKIEEKTTDILDSLCQGPFIVTLNDVQQHFASFMAADITANQQDHYFLPLITEDESHCGFVSFPIETAYILVALMLREMEQIKTEDKKLSGLEDSILVDIIFALVEGLAKIMNKLRWHYLIILTLIFATIFCVIKSLLYKTLS